MSGGNVWSLVEEIGGKKPKSNASTVARSSSFGEPNHHKKSQPSKPNKPTANDNSLRPRSNSLKNRSFDKEAGRKLTIKSDVGAVSAPSSPALPHKANKWPFSRGSFRSAKKKGIEMLKKAGEKVQEMILTDQDSKESETSEEQMSSRTNASNEEFFDAISVMVSSEQHSTKDVVLPQISIRSSTPGTPKSSIVTASPITADMDKENTIIPEQIVQFIIDPNCPIHGTKPMKRARFQSRHESTYRINPKFSLASFDTISDPDLAILNNQGYAAKLARKRRRSTIVGPERERVDREKFKILTNLLVISFAFLFLLSAFHGLQNLQSSVNSAQGLGVTSLGVVYLSLAVSSLFLPPYLLSRLGCKRTLLLSMSMYILYMLMNFSPQWYSLVPASVLLGVSASCLWAAKCTYLTEMAVRYASINVESPSLVIVRFFGIFFMVVHLGQVFGNILSSIILEAAMGRNYWNFVDRIEKTCGHYYNEEKELSPDAQKNLERPPQRAFLAVCGVYVCCALVATLIVMAFLNTLKKDEIARKQDPHFRFVVWQKTLESLRKPKPLLLIPLTIFYGMEQAFIVGEYTKAYVGCCLGISQIGFVMMSFGWADAICSLVFGPLIQLFGRMPLFVFGAVVNMLMIFTLLVWSPNPGDTAIYYVIASAWGMADGVWNTQINGFWVALLGSNLEVAFVNYRLWESVGFMTALFYTPYTSTEMKLYILLTALLLGMIGYALIELWDCLRDKFSTQCYMANSRQHYEGNRKSTLRHESMSSPSQSICESAPTYVHPQTALHM